MAEKKEKDSATASAKDIVAVSTSLAVIPAVPYFWNASTRPTTMMMNSSGTDSLSKIFSPSIPIMAITDITMPQINEDSVNGIWMPKASPIKLAKASPQTLTCSPKNPIREIANRELTKSLVPFFPKVDWDTAQVGMPKSAPCIPSTIIKISVSR